MNRVKEPGLHAVRQRTRHGGSLRVERATSGGAGGGGTLSLAGLIFVGVGGIIGAGYFLGIGLSIQQAGPGILVGFLIGAVIMSQVLGAITSLAVNHPVAGSFRAYAQEMFGPFLGYFQGWLYWLSSLLTVSSEAIAMAVFARVFVPHWPVWLLAFVFTAVVILLNAFGIRAFTKLESLLAGFKIAALVGFCAIVLLVALSVIGGAGVHLEYLTARGGFLPHGLFGVLQSMLIVIFAYAGIGVVATAATELRHPADAGRAAIWVVLGLVVLYVGSLFALLITVPWWALGTSTSPFVYALSALHVRFVADLFNVIILIAAFSVMAGALFSALLILRNMAHVHEAPRVLGSRARGWSYVGLAVTSLVSLLAIGISYILPSQVYSYLISASSYFTFFNWVVILLAWRSWAQREVKAQRPFFRSAWLKGGPAAVWATVVAIVALAAFSLGDASQRMGAIAALLLSILVACGYPLARRSRVESSDSTSG
ncbi:MAG: amino acid permease [Firmicutes bacterium]|nr:amino acid permease [Bacillota bacterium]